MTVPQSFGTNQELITYLKARFMQQPDLHRALKQVALEHPAPRGQVYITRPGILDEADEFGDPFTGTSYRVGAKITYFNKEGQSEQFGQMVRIAGLRDQLLERAIWILAAQLAEGILAHEEAKRPLPTQELTAKDREDICWPF